MRAPRRMLSATIWLVFAPLLIGRASARVVNQSILTKPFIRGMDRLGRKIN